MQSGPTKCGRAHSCRSICRISESSSSHCNGISFPLMPHGLRVCGCGRSARVHPSGRGSMAQRPGIADRRGGDIRRDSAGRFRGCAISGTGVRERGSRLAKLAELALASLEGEVTSVSDLGDGRYEVVVSLSNVCGEQPIYVMSPDMRAYVQVGKIWHKVPLTPIDDSIGMVSFTAMSLKLGSAILHSYCRTIFMYASRIRCWSIRATRQRMMCSNARTITMSM